VDTLKTAAVVVLLLAILYGVYVVLNGSGPVAPQLWPAAVDEPAVEAPDIEIPELPSLPGEFSTGGLQEVLPAEVMSFDTPSPPESFSQQPPPTKPPLAGEGADSQWNPNVSTAELEPSSPPSQPPVESNNLGALNFRRDWVAAQQLLETGKYRETLLLLSKYYHSPDLAEDEHQALLDALDALAGKVIYSTEPLLGEPLYETRGENLYEIAGKYHVPWQLLQNINGLRQPEAVLPHTRLKVVPGPFRAEVSLSRRQLTLFLGDMYAGRFDIGLGDEPAAQGTYSVQRKDPTGNEYFSPRGNLPKGHPSNPYGQHFVDLGGGVSIHGSAADGSSQNQGCISLAPRDAADVASILSERSVVTIKR
jgi:hypothetical protein